jgi:hypothetical protein
MIARKNRDDRARIEFRDTYQREKDRWSRPLIARLHDSLRGSVSKIAEVILLVRSRHRKQDLLRRDASFRPFSSLFQERVVPQARTELLGTIVSPHPAHAVALSDTISTRQNYTPTIR